MNWAAFVEATFILLVCPAAVIGYRDWYVPKRTQELLLQEQEEKENDAFWKEVRALGKDNKWQRNEK